MLELTGINLHYDGSHALKDISIKVKKGQIVTLLGANGAGKSSILHTISGLLKPTSGHILYKDNDIINLKSKKRVEQGIVLIPEGRKIFPDLTVDDNLKLGAYIRKDKDGIKRDYDYVFSLFPRLAERRKQYGGTLSGGEQQMLAVGRGLMAKPELLMMDEPSLGLAPMLVQDIFNIIKKINDDGVTILLVEQNAYKALSIADYGYVLTTGSVAIHDKGEALSQNPEIRKAYLGG